MYFQHTHKSMCSHTKDHSCTYINSPELSLATPTKAKRHKLLGPTDQWSDYTAVVFKNHETSVGTASFSDFISNS